MKQQRWIPQLGLVFCVLTSSPILADTEHKWGKVPPEQWSLNAPSAIKDAAAIVIFNICEVDIPQPYEGNVISSERYCRTKILNKAGADEAISVEITVHNSVLFRGFEAQTMFRDGRKLKVEKKDLLAKTAGNYTVYTFTFPAVEDGCIVEYKFKTYEKSYGVLDPWYFQGPYFTCESSYATTLANGLNYTAIYSNVAEAFRTPKSFDNGANMDHAITYTWTIQDIFPIEREPLTGAYESFLASMSLQLVSFKDQFNHTTFIKDWPTLAELVENEILAPRLGKDKGAKEKAHELSDQLTDPEQKVRALFDFVRMEVLTQQDYYTFYSMENVEAVLKELRGTASEKNLLLIDLMRKSGLTAKPLLIATRDYGIFNPKVCELDQFNHILCLVELASGTYVLDASDRWVPFPYLPSFAIVPGGFLLDGKDSKTVAIKPPARNSGISANSSLTLTEDGSAICRTHAKIYGHFLSRYKQLLEAKPDADRIKESLLEDFSGTIELVDFRQSQLPDADSVCLDLILKIPQYCESVEGSLVGTCALFSPKSSPFTKEHRSTPIDFEYPFCISESIDFILPDSLECITAPEASNLSIDGLRYTRSSLKAGNQAKVMSMLIVGKSLFPPREYDALKRSYETVVNASDDKIAFGSRQ